jgi:hypothetical protein
MQVTSPDIVEEAVAFQPPHLLGYKGAGRLTVPRLCGRGATQRG